MTLRLGGQVIPVAQMGPDFLILKEPASSSARQGTILLVVDGVHEEIPVSLPSGLSPMSNRVPIAEIESAVLIEA